MTTCPEYGAVSKYHNKSWAQTTSTQMQKTSVLDKTSIFFSFCKYQRKTGWYLSYFNKFKCKYQHRYHIFHIPNTDNLTNRLYNFNICCSLTLVTFSLLITFWITHTDTVTVWLQVSSFFSKTVHRMAPVMLLYNYRDSFHSQPSSPWSDDYSLSLKKRHPEERLPRTSREQTSTRNLPMWFCLGGICQLHTGICVCVV